VFDDFKFANDDEAATTSPNAAPYMTNFGPVDRAAHPDIDCTTVDDMIDNSAGTGPAEANGTEEAIAAGLAARPGMESNALLWRRRTRLRRSGGGDVF
jgi:hypothetical protein